MRDGVTFIHAADLHLDAPFHGIAADHQLVGSALAEATYRAFTRVVDACIERDVDFLVIAGDAYNSVDKSLRAQLRFRHEMERLAEAAIPAYVVCGNHDPASGWSAGLALPPSVHFFSHKAVERFEIERDGEVVAAVYGRSFAKAAEKDSLCGGYARQSDDRIAIGVLHCNVGGNPDYDPYSPASLEDLRAAGMDYWALGHIHKQEILSRDPWIVYSGSSQGLNPKEIGPHGCFVVTATASGAIEVEHVETAPVGWAQRDIDISSAVDIDDVRGLLESECEGVRELEQRPVVARFNLIGRTAAHGVLSRPGALDQLLDDLRVQQTRGDDWVWLDRIVDRSAPAIDLDAVRNAPDFSAELVRIADQLGEQPEELEAVFSELAGAVAKTLPNYEPGIGAAQALAAARDLALDRLLADGGDVR